MLKTTGGFLLLGILLIILILNTNVNLLGSGFLVGDGMHVFTYHNLVKEKEYISVKFPNEDDIQASVVFHDAASNLAILKLKEKPKVKPQPLVISKNGLGFKNESVFTLGYPWTNTLQDQHVLMEGSASTSSLLVDLHMDLEAVHSGGPLFNAQQEVVGMVLVESHAKTAFPVEGGHPFAIPAKLLEKALEKVRINATLKTNKNLTREEFISKSRNNIVLIEAR